jgi:hypothetical protein
MVGREDADFLEDFAAFFAAPSVEDGDDAAATERSGCATAAADELESAATAGGAAEEAKEAATVASVATCRADDGSADDKACSGRATNLARAMRAVPRRATDAAAWRRQRHRSKAVAISVASIDRGVIIKSVRCGAAGSARSPAKLYKRERRRPFQRHARSVVISSCHRAMSSFDAETLLSLDLSAIRLPQGDEESERTVQHFLYAFCF